MGFDSGLIDRVLFVRWNRAPTQADMARLVAAIGDARRTAARKIHLVVAVPPRGELPDREAQRIMRAAMPRLFDDDLETMHVVVSGEGVVANAVRSFIRALIIAARLRGRCFIHGSAEDAVAQLGRDLARPGREVLAAARSRALLPAG